MKVLIAEDDPISLEVLQSYLERWGHDVVAAEDGAAAWRLFEADDISLVISDWMMPNMDGLELVRRIRAASRSGYVYVILLTAKSRKEDIVRGMEAGADDFLVKPFDREELRVRLRAGERIVMLEQDLARRNDELLTANRHMKQNLDAAARVQRALLPAALPEWNGVAFAWTFKPCEELAGDIFGVVPLDDRHVGLYVLDVSGHGVAAALLSVSVRHFLNWIPAGGSVLWESIPGKPGRQPASPAEVARQLNRRFPLEETSGQYFTILYGVLDLPTREFRFVSAGHPGPVHLPRGRPPVLIRVSGQPIGITDEADYEEYRLALGTGDRLYLYSDGIPEAFNAADEQFGMQRLMDTLAHFRTASLEASLARLVTHLEEWRGAAQLTDDVSVLAVEVKPEG
jgi:sigma-B regulation protein RsbU (phosphoserine phosphatase)